MCLLGLGLQRCNRLTVISYRAEPVNNVHCGGTRDGTSPPSDSPYNYKQRQPNKVVIYVATLSLWWSVTLARHTVYGPSRSNAWEVLLYSHIYHLFFVVSILALPALGETFPHRSTLWYTKGGKHRLPAALLSGLISFTRTAPYYSSSHYTDSSVLAAKLLPSASMDINFNS